MIQIYRLSGLFLGLVFFTNSVIWADCMSQGYENPFDKAQDIYLARVEAVIPTTVGKLKNSTAAQIKVVKIYKTNDVERVKQINTLSAFDKNSPILFTVGDQYLLYNEPAIAPCQTFDNKKINSDAIRLFEQQHSPVWGIPEQ